jgi:uncharacterized protein (TIGR02246 family)
MKRRIEAALTALISLVSLSVLLGSGNDASAEPGAGKQSSSAKQPALAKEPALVKEPSAAKPVAAASPALVPARAPVSAERQRDEQALLQIIARWDEGWKTFNAELASRDYSSDADWTNAFGLPKQGKAAIFEFLEGAYKSPSMRSRKSTPSTTTFRFVRPDVVSASSYRETIGQGTPTGGVYPTRKTHDLRVFVREKDKWTIVSHLIMDEKQHLP